MDDKTNEKESIKEPVTADETLALHKILKSDPQRYLRIVNQWIDENPANAHAYFSRHSAQMLQPSSRVAWFTGIWVNMKMRLRILPGPKPSILKDG
jgi:hypothetical protein